MVPLAPLPRFVRMEDTMRSSSPTQRMAARLSRFSSSTEPTSSPMAIASSPIWSKAPLKWCSEFSTSTEVALFMALTVTLASIISRIA